VKVIILNQSLGKFELFAGQESAEVILAGNTSERMNMVSSKSMLKGQKTLPIAYLGKKKLGVY